MKKTRQAVLAASLISLAVGCATTDKSFAYKKTGIDKYDNFLAQTQKLLDVLDNAEAAIDDFGSAFKASAKNILKVFQDASDLEDDFAEAYEKLQMVMKGEGFELGITKKGGSTVVTVTPSEEVKPDLVKKVEAALESVNEAFEKLEEIPARLEDIGETTVELVNRGSDLVLSIKRDFSSPLRLLKLPDIIDAMDRALTNLGEVPDRVVNVLDAAGQLLKDVEGLFF